jgi:pimeloyl-ACP methyl ester carboxylesterase
VPPDGDVLEASPERVDEHERPGSQHGSRDQLGWPVRFQLRSHELLLRRGLGSEQITKGAKDTSATSGSHPPDGDCARLHRVIGWLQSNRPLGGRMPTTPPRSKRLPLATGLTCHVLEWDDAREPEHTLILVHGFLDLAWGWEETVGAGLAEQYHVVAPDMRGHGDSDRVGPGGYYHFMDYVADLASIVDLLGRRRVSIVGHSMGGSIASYYAGAFPERVARLALLEGLGPPEDHVPMPERTAAWIADWRSTREREPRSYATLEEAARRLRAHDTRLSEALSLRLAEKGSELLPDGRRRFKHDPLHVTRGPYPFRVEVAASFWKNVSCPVLLVEGSESPFRERLIDPDSRVKHFATVRRELLDGAGHMLQRHRPHELARLLLDFAR